MKLTWTSIKKFLERDKSNKLAAVKNLKTHITYDKETFQLFIEYLYTPKTIFYILLQLLFVPFLVLFWLLLVLYKYCFKYTFLCLDIIVAYVIPKKFYILHKIYKLFRKITYFLFFDPMVKVARLRKKYFAKEIIKAFSLRMFNKLIKKLFRFLFTTLLVWTYNFIRRLLWRIELRLRIIRWDFMAVFLRTVGIIRYLKRLPKRIKKKFRKTMNKKIRLKKLTLALYINKKKYKFMSFVLNCHNFLGKLIYFYKYLKWFYVNVTLSDWVFFTRCTIARFKNLVRFNMQFWKKRIKLNLQLIKICICYRINRIKRHFGNLYYACRRIIRKIRFIWVLRSTWIYTILVLLGNIWELVTSVKIWWLIVWSWRAFFIGIKTSIYNISIITYNIIIITLKILIVVVPKLISFIITFIMTYIHIYAGIWIIMLIFVVDVLDVFFTIMYRALKWAIIIGIVFNIMEICIPELAYEILTFVACFLMDLFMTDPR